MARKIAKAREESRVRAVLSAREKQFQIAAAALRRIIGFQSAQASVFVTEVEQLKLWALTALKDMENAQRPSKKRLTEPDHEAIRAKYFAAKIAGTFRGE